MPSLLTSGKTVGIASAAGVIMLMQFVLLGALLDLASTFILCGLFFMAGRMSK